MAPVCTHDGGDAWVSAAEARRILAVGDRALTRLVESGRLTTRRVPGSIPRFLRSELEALATEATTARKDPSAV